MSLVDPHGLLLACHPDLMKVANLASQTPQAFVIDYGLRSIQAEAQAVATHHSETMHSRHLPDEHFGGKAMAFDFFCSGHFGPPDWASIPPDGGVYRVAAGQILAAATLLQIKVQWGGQEVGAWIDGVVSTFRDWGHIQLDPSAYA